MNEHHAHVVLAASGLGSLNELNGVCTLIHESVNLIVCQHIGKAVAAHQIDVVVQHVTSDLLHVGKRALASATETVVDVVGWYAWVMVPREICFRKVSR